MAEFDTSALEEEEESGFNLSGLQRVEERERVSPTEGAIDLLQRQLSVYGQGTLTIADLPFAVAGLLNMIPGDPNAPGRGSLEKFGGLRPSEGVSDVFGLNPPDPSSPKEQAAFEIGAATGPSAALIKAGSRAPSILRNIGEFAQKNKAKFLAGEAIVAGSVGAARGVVEPETMASSLMLELGVSVLTGGIVSGFSMLNSSVRAARGTDKAAQILQTSVGDVAAAVRALDTPIPGLTPAQLTEDPGLLSIERAQSRTLSGNTAFQQAKTEANAAARLELQQLSGEPGAALIFIEERVRRIDVAIDDSISRAVAEANENLGRFPSRGGSTAEMSETAVKALDTALEEARGLERQAWRNTNLNVQVETQPLKALIPVLEGTSVTQKRIGTKVPDDVKVLINKDFGTHVSAEEIQTFRSVMLDRLRQERGGQNPDAGLIRIYTNLQETALEMLNGGEAIARAFSPEDAALYRQALDVTKSLNQRFYSGEVGQIMRFGTGGARRVNESVALERLLKQGTIGGDNVRQLVETVGPEEARRISVEYMETLFANRAANIDGTLNVNAAEKFLSNNNDLLRELPEVRTQIQATIDAARRSESAVRIGAARTQAVHQRSRAALLLDTAPEKVIPRIRSQRNPVAAAEGIAKTLSTDPDAAMGFKRMFIDDLMKSSEIKGGETLRHPSFSAYLKNNKGIMRGAGFTPDELKRLDVISNNLRKAELSSRRVVVGIGTEQDLTALQSLVGRVAGASTMRNLGFHTIQSTAAGANLGRRIMSGITDSGAGQILEAAVFDVDLMKTLLIRPTAENTDFIINRLRGHFANIGIDIDKDENNVNGVQF